VFSALCAKETDIAALTGLRSIAGFALAAFADIGGACPVRQGVREHCGLADTGAVALAGTGS
jgi:hypothetical protein